MKKIVLIFIALLGVVFLFRKSNTIYAMGRTTRSHFTAEQNEWYQHALILPLLIQQKIKLANKDEARKTGTLSYLNLDPVILNFLNKKKTVTELIHFSFDLFDFSDCGARDVRDFNAFNFEMYLEDLDEWADGMNLVNNAFKFNSAWDGATLSIEWLGSGARSLIFSPGLHFFKQFNTNNGSRIACRISRSNEPVLPNSVLEGDLFHSQNNSLGARIIHPTTLQLFDPNTQQIIKEITISDTVANERIEWVIFSPNNNTLAVGLAEDDEVRIVLIDVKIGDQLLSSDRMQSGHFGQYSVHFSPDSKRVLFVFAGHETVLHVDQSLVQVFVYDIEYRVPIKDLDQFLNNLNFAQFLLLEQFAETIKNSGRIQATYNQWQIFKTFPLGVQEALRLRIAQPVDLMPKVTGKRKRG